MEELNLPFKYYPRNKGKGWRLNGWNGTQADKIIANIEKIAACWPANNLAGSIGSYRESLKEFCCRKQISSLHRLQLQGNSALKCEDIEAMIDEKLNLSVVGEAMYEKFSVDDLKKLQPNGLPVTGKSL